MILQNSILSFFYVIIFLIYLNFDTVELKIKHINPGEYEALSTEQIGIYGSGDNVNSNEQSGGNKKNGESENHDNLRNNSGPIAGNKSNDLFNGKFDKTGINIVYIENDRKKEETEEKLNNQTNVIVDKNESEEINANKGETEEGKVVGKEEESEVEGGEEEGEKEEKEELGEKKTEDKEVQVEGIEEEKESDDELKVNKENEINDNLKKNDIKMNVAQEAKVHKNPWGRLFNVFKKTSPKLNNKNYFRIEAQSEFAFRNGLYFTATTAGEYNNLVDRSKYAYIRLPSDTMILVVTANKFFFQDLIYASNKYAAIKKKFSFIMNNIIRSFKSKLFFKNYQYQYLFRSDSFGYDVSRKLLDFDLLGELSKATQTIYLDPYKKNKVSMHKLYGGWFHFLGILVVNGYSFNPIYTDSKVEVVPNYLMEEFKDLVNKKHDGYHNGYVMGYWRDFPRNRFASWRFSVELFLWDLLNILPYELPHPANLILTYNKNKILHNKSIHEESSNTNLKYDEGEILNWHLLLKEYIRKIRGFDVAMVSVDDYRRAINPNEHAILKNYSKGNNNEYIFLILLNKDFFVDEFLRSENYNKSKKDYFMKRIRELLDKLEEILRKLREALGSDDDNNPVTEFYNYLLEEENYKVLNPHVLGEVAGITKHLKCENIPNDRCNKDVSMHYKYGGWFEFGGAIYIKGVNRIDVDYEKHDIIKKEFENPILIQANCSCGSAGLWRDLPGKDMSPYRYPLNVFTLENPQFNILNIQEVHPFILIDLLNKGLHSMKIQSAQGSEKNNNTEEITNEEESETTNALTDEKSEELQEEEHDAYAESNREENNVDSFTKECIKTEENENILKNEILLKGNDNEENDENNLNNEEDNDNTTEAKEDDIVVGASVLNNENIFSFNKDDENNLYEEYDINETVKENSYENGEMDENFEENNEEYEYNDDEYEDVEDKNEIEDNKKNEQNDTTTKFTTTNVNSNYNGDITYNNEVDEDNFDDNDLEDISDTYELNEEKNDLNKLSSEEDNTGAFNGKILLFIIVCLIAVCTTLLVTVGIRLYAKFMKKKTDNRMAISFKDKEDIPVVQGIPAPWLNA